MAVTDKLIQHLISIQNQSGAIKPAPQALKDVEQKIQGLPFDLGTPAVSNLISSGNMMNGILGMLGNLAGLGDLGNVAGIIGKVTQAANAGNKSGKAPSQQQMVQTAQNMVNSDDLVNAMGDVNSLATSLFGVDISNNSTTATG